MWVDYSSTNYLGHLGCLTEEERTGFDSFDCLVSFRVIIGCFLGMATVCCFLELELVYLHSLV